jgi:hypothetical protein
MADLSFSGSVWIRPPSERQFRLLSTDQFTKLPGVVEASRRPDFLVASEDYER